MGLFQHKPKQDEPQDGQADDVQHFFDENFREELRNHGRWYFEKVITENGELFKQQLDLAAAQVNTDVKERVASQLDQAMASVAADIKQLVSARLDEQLAEHNKALKGAQDVALQSIIGDAHALKEQHRELSATVQKSLADQEAAVTAAYKETTDQVAVMKQSQAQTLEWLTQSVQALQQQHQQISELLQKSIADQEAMIVASFEKNMAQIIEHYLLAAVGDQYDFKAQLPSIIKSMEANRQAIVDDMKL